MTYSDVIEDIEHLDHFRHVECTNCRHEQQVHALQIYMTCAQCGERGKMRRLAGIGSEIQDVVDAVLEWMGTGESFKAVMSRYKEISEATDG